MIIALNLLKKKVTGNIIIIIGVIVLLYLLCSLYFSNHFFFNTTVNGVDLSLKNVNKGNEILGATIEEYSMTIIGRDGREEVIIGKDIDIKYKEEDLKNKIKSYENSFMWIKSLFINNEYYIEGIIEYDEEKINYIVKNLKIVTQNIKEPVNAQFKYNNEFYEIIPEIYGNKINEDKLKKIINENIYKGIRTVNLDENNCYENPILLSDSDKALEIKNLLNKFISTKITYLFEDKIEILDSSIIKNWISVNENLEVIIDEGEISKYISSLSNKYNTVGITRNFNSSVGKVIQVKGGYYGWKINSVAEKKSILQYIKLGASIEREPIYTQKGLYRGDDDIGRTYLEINLTKQYIWFYKNGKKIIEGSIVTGDPRKGYKTTTGTYMINYKQKDTVLRGPGYEAKVKYWMPFNGNIGVHDASWRYSFGGNIYESNGTHGCVNVSLSLAKKIYENIEAGIPVICYEE